MKFYTDADEWDDERCPHTNRHAKPTKWDPVKNSSVIQVKNATYRLAVFSGDFLIDDSYAVRTLQNGRMACRVFCRWFDHRLKTNGIRITFSARDFKILKKYYGHVVSNLSV